MVDQKPWINPLWRLSEFLTVNDAAILICGDDPEEHRYIENNLARAPNGFFAVRNALSHALAMKKIKGVLTWDREEVDITNPDGFVVDKETIDIEGSVNASEALLEVESMIAWLRSRGMNSGFFFTGDEKPQGFRDPNHPRYSAKLAAIVEAWEAYDDQAKERGTPKQRLTKWLRLNAARFGLVDDDGKPAETPIESLAQVGNWKTKGGNPGSSNDEPEPKENLEESRDLDDEIPF